MYSRARPVASRSARRAFTRLIRQLPHTSAQDQVGADGRAYVIGSRGSGSGFQSFWFGGKCLPSYVLNFKLKYSKQYGFDHFFRARAKRKWYWKL